MAGPLTPNRQYDHVTETLIALRALCLSAVSIYFRAANRAALTATVVSYPDSKMRTRLDLIAFLLHFSLV